MSDMKCPFCGQELQDQWLGQYVAHEYFDCPKCKMNGNPKLWQELIRTRKALEITTDAIDEILYLDSGKFCKEPAEMWKIAKSAKDKITILEQGAAK